MTKTKKIKTVVLLIIFAISIIFVVLGSTQNGCSNSASTKTVYTGATTLKSVDSNCALKFNPSTTKYYYVYIDGASITGYSENGGSYKYGISLNETYAYISGNTYDYCYKIYLYSSDSYVFHTNSQKGENIKIYIK